MAAGLQPQPGGGPAQRRAPTCALCRPRQPVSQGTDMHAGSPPASQQGRRGEEAQEQQ